MRLAGYAIKRRWPIFKTRILVHDFVGLKFTWSMKFMELVVEWLIQSWMGDLAGLTSQLTSSSFMSLNFLNLNFLILKVMCPAIASNSAGGNKKHVIFHVITFNVEMRQPLLLSASACSLLCEASISCDQFCITMELTNHNPIFWWMTWQVGYTQSLCMDTLPLNFVSSSETHNSPRRRPWDV